MNSDTDVPNQYNHLLDLVRQEPSHRNYWNVYKRISKFNLSKIKIPSKYKVNIALLSSFTIDPIAAYLDVDSRLIGLFPSIYIAPFNRYQEEVLNNSSRLYQSQPDVILFFVELESLVIDSFRDHYPQMELNEKNSELDRIMQKVVQLLNSLAQQTQALIIFSNFVIPTFSPLGILDNKQEIGYKRFYRILNSRLEQEFLSNNQIFIFDLNEVAGKHGKDKYLNYPMYYRGSFLFNDSFLSVVSHELMGFIKALKAKTRKCIVLDLDNTLWGGIIGEDGLSGIKLNVNYPGNEFIDFQRTLLSLHNRGIILAVNSKNNLEDALEVFQKHPFMLIKEKNLAEYRINWNDKVQNMVELAQSINIGLDSMVFIDDNPVERARISAALPEVLVIDIPSSSALYRRSIEELNDFNTLSLTKEDLQRSKMYFARRKRLDLEYRTQSLEEFIKTLEIVAEIRYANDFSLPRIFSLLNRTNQFNLTTKRYSEAEIDIMYNDPNFLIYTLQIHDKFGDEGIVGIAIIKKESTDLWIIDSFLMSCRVIGRKIEEVFLFKIINDAKKSNKVKKIEAEYIPTKKNSLVKNFYHQYGFNLVEEKNDGSTHWIFDIINSKVVYPDYLKVVEDS
jgi:FkbH-like protein